MPGKTSSGPTPSDLTEFIESPEVAVLAILESTIHVTKTSLIAMHPEYYDPGAEEAVPLFRGSEHTVESLLAILGVLLEHIELYRRLNAARDEETFDIDF